MAFICAVGCGTPQVNPLVGWHSCSSQDPGKFDNAIQSDYRDYIHKLSPEDRKILDNDIWFYEDGAGQQAVKISIPLNGTRWEHVLIYDKNLKRIKTIKYTSGHYRC